MTHKVPVQYRPATTTRNTATSFLRKGQLNRLVKGSVESTHKVPTSHILRKGQLNRHTRYRPAYILFKFTFIFHPGKTHNHRIRYIFKVGPNKAIVIMYEIKDDVF